MPQHCRVAELICHMKPQYINTHYTVTTGSAGVNKKSQSKSWTLFMYTTGNTCTLCLYYRPGATVPDLNSAMFYEWIIWTLKYGFSPGHCIKLAPNSPFISWLSSACSSWADFRQWEFKKKRGLKIQRVLLIVDWET